MTRVFLAIDASTRAGSCAIVGEDGSLLAESAAELRSADQERLMPAIVSVINAAGISAASLAGIICGAGPGSFTGLRISAAIGKGLAAGLAIPLYPVSSLLIAAASAEPALPKGKFVAALDALRGEFFTLICNSEGDGRVSADGEMTLSAAAALHAKQIPGAAGALSVGPGCDVDAHPHARAVALLVREVLAAPSRDPAEWEPHYGRLAEAEARMRRGAGV